MMPQDEPTPTPTNGQTIKAEMLGLVVHVQVRRNGKVAFHRVPVNFQQSGKVINFIKHKCHGGTLILGPPIAAVEPPPAEEKKLIISPP